MTVSTPKFLTFIAAGMLALVAAPPAAWAAPDEVQGDDDDDDDCDDGDDDCDAEGHIKGGCSSTIAPDLGQSIGGLLCALGLLGLHLRRSR